MTRLAACLLLLAAAGCRSRPPYAAPVSDDAFATYDAIVADGDEGIAPEDEALWRCELGSAALAIGEERVAFRAFDGAARIMGTLESTSAENARAILGEEATKTWKGDPHERCMNALYKGLLYWRRGDLDNAGACFRRGLLADAWSEAGEHQRDFAVLAYLLGWVETLRGKDERARFHFREAREHAPHNPWFADPRPLEHNVLLVIDVGRGPHKFADGPHHAVARFARQPGAVHAVQARIDGVPVAISAAGVDLYVQAITRGKRVLDGIRKGKAVFKEGAHIAGAIVLAEGLHREKGGMVAAGLGLLLLSALTTARADTRHWSQLPAEVHVLPLALAPGAHRLRLDALDADARPLPGWTGTFEVFVSGRPGTLYWFRTGPGREIRGLTAPHEVTP